MPVTNRVPVEIEAILKSIDISVLQGLAKIAQNKEAFGALRIILDLLQQSDTKKIVAAAGGFNSLDTLIACGQTQAFIRGRISFGVLLNSLLINSPGYLEKKVTQKEKK